MSTRYHDAIRHIAGRVILRLRTAFPSAGFLVLANPTAGTRRRHREICRVADQLAKTKVEPFASLVWTPSVDVAVAEIEAATPGTIVVSVGGDGTHNHILSTAATAEPNDLAFLRVPAGSGNDSTQTGGIEEFLRTIERPLEKRNSSAVVLETRTRRFFAFNIASLGIDAYITDLHDRWRRKFPGNTYRLAADLAVLRFETIVGLRETRLHGVDISGSKVDFGAAVRNLIAFGVTGHRTYGDHMNVLPGDDNVCIIGTGGIAQKLRMKQLFFSGEHVDQPLTTMAQLSELIVEYEGSLPAQLDGEAHWISSDEFPVRFSLRDSAVTVIETTD